MNLKVKDFRCNVMIFIYSLLIFSSASLFNEKSSLIYLLITILCSLCIFIVNIKKTKVIFLYLFNKMNIWLVLVFSLFTFNALIRLRFGVYNYDFMFMTICQLIIIIVYGYTFDPSKYINIIIKSFRNAVFLIIIYILINEFDKIISGGVRIGDTLSGNEVTVSIVLGVCMLYSFYDYLINNIKLSLLATILSGVFMLLTGSKSSILTILSCLILYSFIEKVSVKTILKIFIITISLIFLIFSNDYFYNIIGFRIENALGVIGLINQNQKYISYSTTVRENMLFKGIEIMFLNPFFGGGHNFFALQSGIGVYSHCSPLEIICNYGLVGFFSYYSMHIFLLIKTIKQKRKSNYHFFSIVLLMNTIFCDFISITYLRGFILFMPLITCYFILFCKEDY